MKYLELIDNMMQFFSDGSFKDEAISAKDDFCRFAGVMDEMAADYEMKFNQFADWYLFTRPLKGKNITPVKLQAQENVLKADDSDLQLYSNLANSRHSLFLYLKTSKSDLHVKDLFSDYKLVIKDSPVLHGFEKDSPFDGRLIPLEDSFVFSNSFCFHPSESKKYIQNWIKKVNKLPDAEQEAAREDLIVKIFQMKYKYERYRHVAITEVYNDESRVKF